ncbi:TrbC/VirB2 family protein [Tabrizicola oligotrophica]|uniref:TrbC/VirB2 family protein n=1 Tax=Tabrizicola oligotrophica TaxID=2710650 RepID=A0A6M0QYY9_9RHOB|nr:TrbC/VirB2 family protein [Tabrizicola oligotrophica]NEY92024.1 TrbC/VirB2 family protein [Tabrizicola oligotrophica]
MNMTYRQIAFVLSASALVLAVTQPALAQTIDFSKAEGVTTGVLTTLRGAFSTAFFGIAFVVTGFMAAFNRISWAWVALVVVGAFFVFAGPAIVANLRSAFS